MKFDYKPPGGGIGGEAEGSVKFTQSISIVNANEESFLQEQTVGFESPVQVPAKILVNFRRDAPVEFKRKAVVYAGLSPNMEGLVMLSQILPNATDRTFDFSGVVENTDVFTGSSDYLEKKLKPSDCPSPNFNQGGHTYKNDGLDHNQQCIDDCRVSRDCSRVLWGLRSTTGPGDPPVNIHKNAKTTTLVAASRDYENRPSEIVSHAIVVNQICNIISY